MSIPSEPLATHLPIQVSSFLPFTQMLLSQTTIDKPQPARRKQAPVQNLTQLQKVLNSHARLLILDLEFFQAGPQHHISQLAGRLYDQPLAFNYYFYNNQQSGNRQLQFLRRYDIPLSQACHFTIKQLLPRVVALASQINPDYIVSWDNSLDFKTLQTAADQLKIPKRQRF